MTYTLTYTTATALTASDNLLMATLPAGMSVPTFGFTAAQRCAGSITIAINGVPQDVSTFALDGLCGSFSAGTGLQLHMGTGKSLPAGSTVAIGILNATNPALFPATRFRSFSTNLSSGAKIDEATVLPRFAEPIAQAISFTSTAPAAAVIGGTYTVSATGGTSGLPVILTIDPSASAVCSMAADTVTFTAVGTCTVNADQAGNAAYDAAPRTQQSFAVAAKPVVSATGVPTLGEWGLIGLSSILAMLGLSRMRRRQR